MIAFGNHFKKIFRIEIFETIIHSYLMIVLSPDRFIPFLFAMAQIKTEKSGLGTRLIS